MVRRIDWETFFQTAAGRTALAWEEASLARLTSTGLGDRALQIGLTRINPFEKCPICHRIVVTREPEALGGNDLRVRVLADDAALPLENECCDLVVWPHGPDRCGAHTAAALTEIERVLAPNGLLLATFFNPLGSWKLREKLLGSAKILPDGSAEFSLPAVKSLVVASGLKLEGGSFGVYAVNTAADPANRSLPTWIDKAGDRWWPTLSNVVLLSARKTKTGATLVGRVNFARAKSIKAAGAVVPRQGSAKAPHDERLDPHRF